MRERDGASLDNVAAALFTDCEESEKVSRFSISPSLRAAPAKQTALILRPSAAVWLPACARLRESEPHDHFSLS